MRRNIHKELDKTDEAIDKTDKSTCDNTTEKDKRQTKTRKHQKQRDAVYSRTDKQAKKRKHSQLTQISLRETQNTDTQAERETGE